MEAGQPTRKVTVFLGESDRWDGRPLHQALLERLRALGCSGATVLRGVAGFGESSIIHTASVLRLSEDLPVVLLWVDTPENVERSLPEIEPMLGGGLVLVEDGGCVRYACGVPREGSEG